MAIAFDAATSYHDGGNATTHTYSHTCGSGDNRILWVHVMNSSSVAISSVTYNGVSMTSAVANSTGQRSTLFYLVAPATGANDVVVTIASASYAYMNSASYTGAKQTGVPDATNSSASAAATRTTSVTAVDEYCWTVLGARQASTGNTAAGTGTYDREDDAGYAQFYDSNGYVFSGSTSLQTTQSATGTTGHAMASFAPAEDPTGNTASTDLETSSSQYWSHADNSIFDISTSTDRTMEAWVKAEGGAANQAIMGKWSASAKNWLLRMESGGEPKFFVGNGGSSTGGSIAGTTDISTGAWFHIALTYTASDDKARIYVNGVLEGTSSTLSPVASSEALGIGAQDGSGGISSSPQWDGLIDDVRWWSTVRTGDEILENMQSQLVGDESGLEGYWQFNGGGTDTTSNGYDLTNNNSATFSTDVSFNPQSTDLESGSSQYWSITDAAQTGLDLSGDFTMEWWVKLESTLTTQSWGLVDKWVGGGNQRSYQVTLNNSSGDRASIFLSHNGSTTNSGDISFSSDLSIDTWYHVAITYDASAATVELFLDGVSQGTAGSMGTSIYNSSSAVEIGGTTSYADGLMDEVRFWNDIRTDDEIDDNKCVTLAGTEANLVGYWRFDGQGVDQSGNGNYLTNNNSATLSTTIFTDAAVCGVTPPAGGGTTNDKAWQFDRWSNTSL